jgi:hypothetical protein
MLPVLSDSTANPAAALVRPIRPSWAKSQSSQVSEAPWERM